ncbi:MAG TPA: Hsp20/alpha crystallin family protein [Opitutaceae bacterium]|nr:Hsp20/alpha crystallin family protein [Opitutaceae bacterium]
MSRLQNLVSPFARRSPAPDTAEATVRPWFELKETPEAWGLTVYLPGVAKDGLEITAEEGRITVRGRRQWKAPAGWTALYRESPEAAYELSFSHDNTIDVGKIHAELVDGVLRASLPKAEAIKPRKIAVN